MQIGKLSKIRWNHYNNVDVIKWSHTKVKSIIQLDIL